MALFAVIRRSLTPGLRTARGPCVSRSSEIPVGPISSDLQKSHNVREDNKELCS